MGALIYSMDRREMTKLFDCITNDRLKLIVQQPNNLDVKIE
jgi:hypothetical protein